MIHTHDVSTAALMSSGLAADIPSKLKENGVKDQDAQQKTDDKTLLDPLCRVWRRFPGKMSENLGIEKKDAGGCDVFTRELLLSAAHSARRMQCYTGWPSTSD